MRCVGLRTPLQRLGESESYQLYSRRLRTPSWFFCMFSANPTLCERMAAQHGTERSCMLFSFVKTANHDEAAVFARARSVALGRCGLKVFQHLVQASVPCICIH
jgi:hypothetical protein